jgi:hypothetical protein
MLSLVFTAIAVGCSKKQEATAPPAEISVVAPAATTPARATQSTAAPQEVSRAIAESQAALKANEYEKAAQAMLAIQRAQLTEKEATAARQQMISLQSAVTAGLGAGDPRAKAAADLLRRASSVH